MKHYWLLRPRPSVASTSPADWSPRHPMPSPLLTWQWPRSSCPPWPHTPRRCTLRWTVYVCVWEGVGRAEVRHGRWYGGPFVHAPSPAERRRTQIGEAMMRVGGRAEASTQPRTMTDDEKKGPATRRLLLCLVLGYRRLARLVLCGVCRGRNEQRREDFAGMASSFASQRAGLCTPPHRPPPCEVCCCKQDNVNAGQACMVFVCGRAC